ncbi:MAG: DNA polymerase III subunit alpha [Holosporales bacterium]|jgi:DNA polymerase-3 subunit alpha|nr:DNA polymerase III subunit alpha [Holosporales bacterium]
MSDQPFVHLRLHTAYSLSEGAVRTPELAEACVEKNFPAVAITDTNNMFGVLDFSIKCASNGIQPISGCVIDIKFENIVSPVVLLAQNEIGYKNLLKLMTVFYIEHSNEERYLTFQDISKYNSGIIALSGGAFGPSGKLFLQGHQEKSVEFLNNMNSLFRNNFYIEISRHNEEIEIKTEDFFIDFAIQNDIPIVATNEVFFLEKDMHVAHDILSCIACGTYLAVEDRRRVSAEHYLKSSDEMFELFSDIKEATSNTSLIAKRCSFMPEKQKPMLPRFDDGSGQNEDDILEKQAIDGLIEKLKNYVFHYKENRDQNQKDIEKQYFECLQYELSVIKAMGFSGYFLIVADFVRWAKANDIPVGPGRGSGAGSVVAWSLQITNLDPIKYFLIFERFLNPDRVSMPDFDIDFCQNRRDEVIEYVQSKYGKERVAHIITFGTLQARAVLRDVGRVLQFPYGLTDKICKLVPNNPAHPVDLRQALKIEPQLTQLMDEQDSVHFLINTGLKLEGLFRHVSMHAAGIVIGNRAVDEIVPLYSDGEAKLAITQFNMKFAEAAGLVKFDFLGLKTLTIIKQACDNIKKYLGVDLDIDKIDLEDKKTFNLLCNVDVVGIFQLESSGMKDVIQKLQPDSLEDLIALVSLYRPGPLDDIPKYLARKHGKEAITYLHPILEPILRSTYGVMVYQEQVMKIAQEMGGYSLAAADLLRRAMGKKIKSEMEKNREIFMEGAKQKGVQPEISKQVFSLMGKFASYGFNRSHAAPYALLSYQTAYLKANYRREFYISILNLDIDNTEKVAIFVQDARNSGISVLPPDINISEEYFIKDPSGGIRYSFGALRGNSIAAMKEIVAERNNNGEFKDVFDFFKRINTTTVHRKQIEALVLSGAFDSIHFNRRQLFESLDNIIDANPKKAPKQASLFNEYNTKSDIALKDVEEWSEIERLEKERYSIGFYLQSHPMDVYSEFLRAYDITRSRNFSATQENITVAGIMLRKKEKLSKNSQKYAFITVSDQDNAFEVTIFPELYSKVDQILKIGQPLILETQIKIEAENIKLLALSLRDINSIMDKEKFYLPITENSNIDSLRFELESIENGNNPISFLIIKENGKKIEIETNYKKRLTIESRKKLLSLSCPSKIVE